MKIYPRLEKISIWYFFFRDTLCFLLGRFSVVVVVVNVRSLVLDHTSRASPPQIYDSQCNGETERTLPTLHYIPGSNIQLRASQHQQWITVGGFRLIHCLNGTPEMVSQHAISLPHELNTIDLITLSITFRVALHKTVVCSGERENTTLNHPWLVN